MRKLLLFIISVSMISSVFGQDITGNWKGTLKIQNIQLPIEFKISKTTKGYSSTMSSPNQGAIGIPVSVTKFADSKLSLIVTDAGIEYFGTLENENVMVGDFNQAGQSFSLKLLKEKHSFEQEESLKLLVVTGGPTLRHQIDLVPTSFYSLMDYENLSWDHATQDEAAFQSDKLQEYDAILMYNRSDYLSEKSKENLKKYLVSGKGLILLHHALGSYNNWEWWWKEVVGGKYQMNENGNFKKSDFNQDETINMIAKKNHPITKGIDNFTLYDETYKNLWLSKELEILYQTNNPSSDGPMVWISPYKKSKVVIIQPGHAQSAHHDSKYKKLIYQAILWASNE